jgi:plastocyanin
MYNALDSRALGRADCYGQRFMRPGDYCYDIVPAHGHPVATHRPYKVRVRPGDGKGPMKQHNVRINANGGGFVPAAAELVIEVGDLVLWNCPDGQFPYAVIGDHDFFASHKLVNECGYTHAFGTEGEFHWSDAYGSGACGTVRVRQPDCSTEKGLNSWREALGKGSLVMITGKEAKPREVDIVVGQTIYFAVVKGGGISVTDDRLLGGDEASARQHDTRPDKNSTPRRPARMRPAR